MPILSREPDIFPADLLDRDPISVEDHRWWAMYTLSRREKDLMRRLHSSEIPFYSPLVKKRSRSAGGRVRTSYVPLFPGYVFLYGDDDQRRAALATHCVSRCLEVADGLRLVDDLRQIHRMIEADVPLTPEARLEPGRRVRVRSGLMAGIEGVVIQRRAQARLLVAVEFLQQGVSMDIDDFAVERID